MRRTRLWLIVFGMLSAGCPARLVVIPDRTVPHRVAEACKVPVWVRSADGSLVKRTIELDEGWYVAAPEALR